MAIELLDGNAACAYAMVLAKVESFPCFPITPQTELLHLIAEWKATGKFKGEFNIVDSEHSVLSAALGSEMVGARTFTSTSSQGIMLMHEILPIVSGNRMPVTMVNGARGLSAPITLWADHNDFLAMRDSGWLMAISASNQELLDSIIMSFKIGENRKLMLPSLVNMDGFIQSYTRTQVDVPSQALVNKFLPKLKLDVRLDTGKPMTLGTPVLEEYMYFRSQMQKAHLDSVSVIKKVQGEWAKLTGRRYGMFEAYRLGDAKAAIVVMGANSNTARIAVNELRKEGKKVGMLRLRVIRPWPEKEIAKALGGIKSIAVVDQNLAPGRGGIMYPEIKAALCGSGPVISSYIAGLGGKNVSLGDFKKVLKDALSAKKEVRRWMM